MAISHTLAKDVVAKLPFVQFFAVRTLGGVAATAVAIFAMGDLPALLALSARESAMLFGTGLLVPLTVNVLSFWSMKRMPLNVHAPLFRTYVVNVFLLSLVFLDERLTPLAAAAVLITFGGVVAFSSARAARGQAEASRAATVVCLAAACLMSVGVILWKRYSAFTTPSIITFTGTATTALVYTVVYAIRRPPSGSRGEVAKAVLSGMLVFGVGNFLWVTALGYSSSPVVSAVHSTSTLIIAVLAYLFLRERWTRTQAIAALAICVGVALLFLA